MNKEEVKCRCGNLNPQTCAMHGFRFRQPDTLPVILLYQ